MIRQLLTNSMPSRGPCCCTHLVVRFPSKARHRGHRCWQAGSDEPPREDKLMQYDIWSLQLSWTLVGWLPSPLVVASRFLSALKATRCNIPSHLPVPDSYLCYLCTTLRALRTGRVASSLAWGLFLSTMRSAGILRTTALLLIVLCANLGETTVCNIFQVDV